LADRLVDRFNLMQVYRAKLRSLARETLANNTIILEDRRTGLITITVRDHDKQRARDLAQAYTEELNRLNAEMNAGAAHQQRVFLEQRLEEVKTQLDKTSNELANFSSRSAVFAPDQLKAQAESAAKLEGTLMGLQTTLSGLLERYTEKNLRVQEVEAQIASVQEQLRKLRGNQPSGGSGGGSEPLFPNLSSLSHLQPAYTGLLRDSKGLTAVYEILEQQLELAKIEEVKELPTIRVLDTPELADFRVSPHRRAILMVAGFFGLLVGAGYVLLRNYSAQGGFGSVIGFLRFRILDTLGPSEGFTPGA
jgi:capsule polysaccharide export protein KpsE/RkpR